MSSLSTSLIDDYIAYYQTYTKEYGEKTCILLQNGIFYEMIMVKNDKECIGNLIEVCGLLNIQVSRKNKNIDTVDRKNPLFGGFQKISMSKYLPLLLDNGYTVVVIDQDENKTSVKKKRSVTAVYSPGIQPMDIIDEKNSDGNNISSVIFDIKKDKKEYQFGYSICSINMSTNTFDTYEMFQTITHDSFENVLDEVYRILLRYNTRELLTFICYDQDDVPKALSKESLENYLEVGKIHWKKEDLASQCSANYQNMFFKKVYSHITFGLLSPIEYFGLECRQLTAVNCIQLIDFIAKHDKKYVSNLSIPSIVDEYKYLSMPLNTIRQLNILPGNSSTHKYASLFNVVNKTKTSIGRRALKQLLCKPYKSFEEIDEKYIFHDAIDEYAKTEHFKQVQKFLEDICDFEKLQRKLNLCMLHPYELCNLLYSYQNVILIHDLIAISGIKTLLEQNLSTNAHGLLTRLVTELENTFDLTELKKYNLSNSDMINNYFKVGTVPELDKITSDIEKIESNMESKRVYYDKLVNGSEWIKLVYTDQEGYMFTCTKIRFELLKSKMGKEFQSISVKQQTSTCKFVTDELKSLSLQLTKTREILSQKVKAHYLFYLETISKEYCTMFHDIKCYIEKLDIAQSNLVCAKQYNYCKPVVKKDPESFIQVKNLRHAIIERVNDDVPYIPNDIELTKDSNGIILYALNSCGKSSLLKSVGLCMVLAQCGLYVPCSELVFAPFDTLISQVDSHDNLWKCQSSFVTEMIGLRKIQKVASEKCLVLADELTHSTEHLSATALFSMSVLHLVTKKAKFIFTTHLHEVANIDEIKNNSKLNICHLSVSVNQNDIIFERKLQPGPCDSLYGLEIAKAVGLNEDFISSAFNVRNRLLNNKSKVVSNRKSKYNSKKIIDECEICAYAPVSKTDIPLDVHHIEFQCTADDNNFTKHFHKNSKFNLVTLCKSCHQKVHNNHITIQGYTQTTAGVKLHYELSGQ